MRREKEILLIIWWGVAGHVLMSEAFCGDDRGADSVGAEADPARIRAVVGTGGCVDFEEVMAWSGDGVRSVDSAPIRPPRQPGSRSCP